MAGRPPKPRSGDAGGLPKVEAVERALRLLDAFLDGPEACTLSELARATGLYPSTALRLCGTLEASGYLTRDDAGAYRLGPVLSRLGRQAEASFPMGGRLRAALERLAARTGETAAFYVREGDIRRCRFRVNGPRPVRSHLEEGSALPLDRGAGGHVLLAFTGSDAPRHREVRREGFSLSRGERDTDSAALAVPLFDPSGIFLGALGLAGPVTRFGDDAVPSLLEAVRAEAAGLGGAAAPDVIFA